MRYAALVGALIAAAGLTVRAQPGAPATRTLRGGVEPAPRAGAEVTFTKDIAPILHAKCITCHRPGEVAPMALRTYDEVRPWARAIKQKVVAREMPPWFADPAHGTFANDARLSQPQIDTIVRWVDTGAARGLPGDEPKLPSFSEGWQLGEPDYIITLPLVNIPAEGKDYFPTPNLKLDLAEDRWIRALEIRPSNREVTHHTVIFTAGAGLAGASGFFDVLGVWAVGTPPTVYPDGTGRWVRKGQQLRTNLHYHPNGTAMTDQTRIGLYWGKGELKKEVVSAVTGELGFRIPPREKNHEMHAVYVVDQDVNVVSYFPHMHLRGKDMRMTATLPNGQKKTLLNVPAYDFNWQLFYYPSEPVPLPRGTRVDVVAHYDNSADNKHNPDPDRAVTFGEQSSDEMMFGVFEFTPAEGVSPKPVTGQTRMEALQTTLPAETSYRVMVTVLPGRPAFASILHLPKQGEGTWYIAQGALQINVVPIKQINWNGDAFDFRMDIRFGANAAFTFDAKGTVTPDGSVRADITPVGVERAPFSRTVEGSSRTWK